MSDDPVIRAIKELGLESEFLEGGQLIPDWPETTGREYIPTAEQIREACQEIQEGWTDEEEQKRRYIQNPEVTFNPICPNPERKRHGTQGIGD